MDWLTLIFTAMATACLTLAVVHYTVWLRQRKDACANLMLALTATWTAGMAVMEMLMGQMSDPVSYATALRGYQVLIWATFLSLVGFIRCYFPNSRRRWLGLFAVGLRTVLMLSNAICEWSSLFVKIHRMLPVEFLGSSAWIPDGEIHPLTRLGQTSLLALAVYILDVCFQEWRRGNRRSVLAIGGGVLLMILVALGHGHLVLRGEVPMPLMASSCFLGIVLIMGYKLSLQLVHVRALEIQLQDTEARLSIVAETANISVWSLDRASQTFWAPANTRTLFGFHVDARVTLKDVLAIIHEDDLLIVMQVLEEAWKSKSTPQVEYRILMPDGSIRWMVSNARPQMDSKGRVTGLVGVSLDVSELRQAEENLRHESALLQAVFDSVPGLIYLYDEAGRLERWNRNLETLTGYSAEELMGRLVSEWFDGADLEKLGTEWQRVFSEGRGSAELNIIVKDGRRIPFLFTGVRVMLEGRPCMVGMGIELTERRRIEGELQQHRERLAQMARAATLGELSGALAHELNQPLAIILSNAQAAQALLSREPPDLAEVNEILTDIIGADGRARDVIKGLRSVLEGGKTLQQPVDLNQGIQEVLRLAQRDLADHEVRVKLDLARDLPLVLADRIQVQQVVLNLINNARDAMLELPEAERVIQIRSFVGAGLVHVTVVDQGPGLPSDAESLFRPFYSTKPQGLGVGLSICRKLVEVHGGRLWAEPASPRGALFHFTFPVLQKAS